jgi:signal transduction histidine kinase
MAVVVAIAVLTFLLSAYFELHEWLRKVLEPLEAYQADELPVTLLAMSLALAWYSWRRSRQVVEQSALREAVQQALLKSESQYRELFMENLSANILTTPEGRVKLANPAAAQLLGMNSPEALVGRGLGEFYADSKLWESHVTTALRGEKIDLPALPMRRLDDVPVHTVARLCARTSPAREQELHLYVTDITEVTLMQGELADALQENRRLSQRSIQVQEEERRHLARELHDELGQSLNAIKVDAVNIRDRSQPETDVRQSAQAIIDVSSQVYEVVRGLMQRLRPVALDELGLRSAVQYSVDQWQRRHPGVQCIFDVDGDIDNLGEELNITLYRLVQECLTNVAKHASATRVSVEIQRTGAELGVTFRDDGRGFDPGQRNRGLGLVGLRERVEALGGKFTLESVPGHGASIGAQILLREVP